MTGRQRTAAKENFNDDQKDAGEIGAGHSVTACYEIVPAKARASTAADVDPLKYQTKPNLEEAADSNELMTVKLRYKEVGGDTSKLLEFPVKDEIKPFAETSRDFRFATAVAGFGMLLRGFESKANLTWEAVREIAVDGRGEDKGGYRREFVTLVDKARELDKKRAKPSEP